ncbi:acetyltransferase [Fulvivirga imtechensis AK7]|uniref:Acetyltransferase n=1 Tax=Fulvivirga imtechensis AK7 TaxID=1237149 RepID=L8JP80_9BACT|nr:GNAT family protein [Fulvivirga imtechensis]ELR70650.1 acetyltransferase [Fulvivirga imtechensis AK7]
MLQDGPIRLRGLDLSDKKKLALLANNKKVWDNLRDYMPHPYSEEDAVDFIRLTDQEAPKLTFAIEYNIELCGVIGLVPQKDVYRRTAEIGYCLGEPFWGKGIATTAVKLLTAYGFQQIDLVRIHTGVFEYNTVSMRVLEKNGYKKEGIFKHAVLKNGKIWDEHRYAKLREEEYAGKI